MLMLRHIFISKGQRGDLSFQSFFGGWFSGEKLTTKKRIRNAFVDGETNRGGQDLVDWNDRLKNIVFQLEQLYIEVLYTVANTVGASTGQYAHYKEDLYRYAQEAFGVPQDQHRRYLNIASEEKVCSFFSFNIYYNINIIKKVFARLFFFSNFSEIIIEINLRRNSVV